MRSKDRDWPIFLNDINIWLNKHIAPHNLTSISIFEDEHPLEKGVLNAVIVHSGAKPDELID